jgi:G3E family GTPase
VHDEHCAHDHDAHDHEHDDEIKSVALTLHTPMDRRKVSRWLTGLVAKQGQDILRAKGIIDVKNENRRLVFQSVHMVLEGDLQREWRPDEPRYSRIVFIGRNLDRAALQAGFEACVATAPAQADS